MAYKLIIGTIVLWITIAFICGGFQGHVIASGGGYETNVVNRFLSFSASTDQEAFGQSGVIVSMGMLESLWDIVTFNFPSIFYGVYANFRFYLGAITVVWLIALICIARGVSVT